MKFKSARIRNFRLLRDVGTEFSHDPARPLTVIRAENGSGKTSMLMALQWALYGREGLEDPSMRLSPVDWPSGQECEISVQLDFSHTLYNIIAGESVGTTTDFRLVRLVTERPEGDRPNRGADRVTLYRFGEGGLDKVEAAELRIGEMLPKEMKDIFFTDGDAALTFISPQLTTASRRDQVREAIRSLLGLGLLEGATAHIVGARRRYNSEVSKASQSDELSDMTLRLTNAEDSLAGARERLRDVEKQIEELARRHEDADKKLEAALQAGDYEQLAAEARQAGYQLEGAAANEQPLKLRHQGLIQDDRLSLVLLGPKLAEGFGELAKMHEAGIIPSGSVPVLEERLELQKCICGTPLTSGSEARKHVEELIAKQKTVEDKRKILTELHHAAKVDLQRYPTAASAWLDELENLERTRLHNRKAIATAGDQLKLFQDKIGRIDKAGINETRKDRDSIRASLSAKQDERRNLQTDIDKWQAIVDELQPKQAALRMQDQKLERLNNRLTVTEDIAEVVRGALEDLEQIYISRVSERMNDLFLEMVGADPETMAELTAGAGRKESQIFSSASISKNNEIIVHSGDRTLSPEHELNGASKRALTFSFIWALTEVSQVIAPRIIDTPLGMMSGRVKRRVLELITAPAGDKSDIEKQIVLFLTREEIRGVEPIIDDRAGRVITLSNSDHYPVDLTIDPGLERPEIMRCECNHRQFCSTCSRRDDEQYGLVERPVT